MAYHFSHQNSSVQDAVRKLAIEQIDKAIATFDQYENGDAIHQSRKACKKLRGLIRLVEPVFAGFEAENAAIRDAARELSSLRDNDVLVKTYDTVCDVYRDQIDRPAFAPIRRYYTLRGKRAMKSGAGNERVEQFRQTMNQARQRAATWTLEQDGFDALGPGLAKSYKKARRALKNALADPSNEAIHELRKGVKYHWYHTRLLQPIWPKVLKVRRKAAKDLSEYLGDHHDLAVFSNKLLEDRDMFGGQRDLEVMFMLVRRRQAALTAKALPLAARLLAEPPRALKSEWGRLWDVWQAEKPVAATVLAA